MPGWFRANPTGEGELQRSIDWASGWPQPAQLAAGAGSSAESVTRAANRWAPADERIDMVARVADSCAAGARARAYCSGQVRAPTYRRSYLSPAAARFIIGWRLIRKRREPGDETAPLSRECGGNLCPAWPQLADGVVGRCNKFGLAVAGANAALFGQQGRISVGGDGLARDYDATIMQPPFFICIARGRMERLRRAHAGALPIT